MSNNGPIADLSYRGYDGPLDPPRDRWKVIARMTMRHTLRNRWYWVLAAFSGWYYAVLLLIHLVMQQILPANMSEEANMFGLMLWNDQFLHGFSYGQFFYMLIIVFFSINRGSE